METNNNLLAIIVIIAVVALILVYMLGATDGFKVQNTALRRILNLGSKKKKQQGQRQGPATQLMTDWYIQIANVKDGEIWDDKYEITMTSDQEEYVIGRDSSSDLVLPDATVSSIHGAIRKESDGTLVYENRSESNKTVNFRNKQQIDEVELTEGLDILIGIYELCFHHTDVAPVFRQEKEGEKASSTPSRKPSSNKKDDGLNVLKVGKLSDYDSKTKLYDKK